MGADRFRPTWGSLPRRLRTSIVDAIGGEYVADAGAHGGFGAGYAGVVRTTAGAAFVKAIAPDAHADSRSFLRREAEVLRLAAPPTAPALIEVFDDDHGTALVLEAIDGAQPGAPWRREDLHAIAETLSVLAETPAPAEIPAAEQDLNGDFTRWREISETDALRDALPDGIRDRLDALIDLDAGLADVVRGDALMHGDLRADNLLIADGRARLVDWPAACRGTAWLDVPLFVPSVEAAGGPDCAATWEVFREHGAPAPEALLPVLAGFASYLWFNQARAEIPQLPGLRAFQRAQAMPALRWLAELI
ncbi:phosphotransferase family protein [Microbacterium tumbae]